MILHFHIPSSIKKDQAIRLRQQFLYFLPEPQGQGAFLPTGLLTPREDFSSLISKLRIKDEIDTSSP